MSTTLGAVLSDGNATGILNLTSGAVLFTSPVNIPFNSRTSVERFPSGLFAFGNFVTATGPLSIWKWNGGALFSLIVTLAAPMGITGKWYALSANGAVIWASDTSGGLTTPTFRRFDQTGAVLQSVGPITSYANGIQAMTPALDNSVMYYSNGLTGTPIKVWNLSTNLAGADLVTPADIVTGLWPVPGSTDIVALTETAYSGNAPVNIKAIRYTTAGAVVYSTTVYTLPKTVQDTRLDVARDPSLSSIWIRTSSAPAYDQSVASIYINVDLLLGGTLSSTTIATPTSIGYVVQTYGAPFLILSAAAGVPGGVGTPCTSFT